MNENKIYGIDLSKGEATAIMWIINKRQGVDKPIGRIVAIWQDLLPLEDIEKYPYTEWKHPLQEKPYTVIGTALKWIKEEIDEFFSKKEVPPQLARYCLSLYDRIVDTMSEKE